MIESLSLCALPVHSCSTWCCRESTGGWRNVRGFHGTSLGLVPAQGPAYKVSSDVADVLV